MSEEAPTEDIVAKYKRLLSLARSSLEANQTTIAAKDQYIANLLAALEEEKAKSVKKQVVKEDEAAHLPRRILCRVDVDDKVWILIEYDDSDDIWKFFTDEQSMFDYLQRIPGVPLICPPKCLTAQESHQIEEQSKSRVERIVEEFRRYKVRTEIARKQKDAENKQALLNGSNAPTTVSAGGLSGTLEKALTNGATNNSDLALDETKRLKQLLEDQEAKWRSAYEKIARENETLRNKGGESVLATQWRNRYETCLKERDELNDKLKKYTKLNDELGVDGVPVEQAYLDLQDEFREFRRKVAAIEKRRKLDHHHSHSTNNNSSSGEGGGGGDGDISALIADYELEDSIERHHQESVSNSRKSLANSSSGGVNGIELTTNSGIGGVGGLTEAKIQYVRSMIVQYLACKEPEVKAHMENALIVLFRFTVQEREAIEERRREESQDTLSTLTSFLGGLSS